MPKKEIAEKHKKPANTAFKQQRLRAWQPILTPKTVLPTFFTIGALFIPIGIGLFIASEQVNQVTFDYSSCKTSATSTLAPPNPAVAGISQWQYDPESRNCTIQFHIDKTFTHPVFLYYRLTNFYQNHRRYVKSFDAYQLRGDYINGDLTNHLTNCDPLKTSSEDLNLNGTVIPRGAQIYPCGLIANSLFTDEIYDLRCVGNTCARQLTYSFSQKNIAWPSDNQKFGSSSWLTENPSAIPTSLVPPPTWRNPHVFGGKYVNGYNQSNLPRLAEMERLHVWTRTAGLPNFRKLWGRNDRDDLTPETWEIVIQDNFNVTDFSGTKSIVISTISILGGKNPFLGIAYIVMGIICIGLGVIFLLRHMFKPRKIGDHTYLSWNQPSTKTETEQRPERTVLMQ